MWAVRRHTSELFIVGAAGHFDGRTDGEGLTGFAWIWYFFEGEGYIDCGWLVGGEIAWILGYFA